ncbi:MAG TPA: GPR endopeptidase [Firmicutes bacterium]|jgi:spore protease|nr:GPR endopeptidase [Bacillota bacterium]
MNRKRHFFSASDARTDLALEAHEMHSGQGGVPGVHISEQKMPDATVTRVNISSPQGEEMLGKPQGNYITIEARGLRERNRQLQERIAAIFAEELQRLMPQQDRLRIFVVGLGNWNATPDALGPQVVSNLLITRHLHDDVPTDVQGGLRSVCAIAPGVLGLTGIETGEIIMGIVQQIKPDIVIAVDALAARHVDRIFTTIQISDTGISPGSGVGHKRVGINQQTLSIPVLAVGVPTVVHAVTIASNTVELLVKQLRREEQAFYEIIAEMGEQDQQRLINEVLTPAVGSLMVTPKEIDVYIEDFAKVVAGGMNIAFHPGIDSEQAFSYLN